MLLPAMQHMAISEDLTPEQLVSYVAQPEAVLFGPAGAVAGIADGARVGRDRTLCDIAVLHPSVSALHARIERTAGGWRIVDLGSRNGTAVAGVIARPDAPLVAGAPVRLGDVVLGFSPGVAPMPRRRRRSTSPVTPLVVTIETDDGKSYEVSSNEVRGASGAVALAPREVELVVALIARRRQHHPELAYVRGAELADSLGFCSIDADDENVRELVLRVRKKLRAIGGDHLIETRRNAGYRLGGHVGAPRPR
jgi:pSer/pThr/pTyr-binding forkhead associated (FHA) protein